MTKLSLLLIVCVAAIGYFHSIVTFGESVPEDAHVEHEDHEAEERNGARAQAQASVRIRQFPSGGGGFGPNNGGQGGNVFVQCYNCVDCPKVYFNTTSKWCPLSFDESKARSCVVYSEKYKNANRHLVIRGCASERGSCSEIKQAHSSHSDVVKLLKCNQCEGDRCNGATAMRSLSDITIAFIALILTPCTAKYALS